MGSATYNCYEEEVMSVWEEGQQMLHEEEMEDFRRSQEDDRDFDDTDEVETQEDQKERTCPVCKKTYSTFPALSRRDNKTEICPDCGTEEALTDYIKSEYVKCWKCGILYPAKDIGHCFND